MRRRSRGRVGYSAPICFKVVILMVFPDWGAEIMAQVVDFLEWDAVAQTVTALVGVAVGSVLLSMFLRVFFRG